jgi:hypothetical protein
MEIRASIGFVYILAWLFQVFETENIDVAATEDRQFECRSCLAVILAETSRGFSQSVKSE